jgi:16S rRNA (guanine966-N2)-methyltransferase
MRIISGDYKGKKIFFPSNPKTRPLKDFVKENLFNVINHSSKFNIKIKGAEILDLYSGSGSFGLECISRGAKKVTFIEEDKETFKILKKNINLFDIKKNFNLINNSIEEGLMRLNNKKFDIIFFDPPFKDTDFINYLKKIKDMKLFKPNHLVIIHRENKKEIFSKGTINILKIKSYRRSNIFFTVY